MEVRGSKWETKYRDVEFQVDFQDVVDITNPLLLGSMEEVSTLLMPSERGWVYVRHLRLHLYARGSESKLS